MLFRSHERADKEGARVRLSRHIWMGICLVRALAACGGGAQAPKAGMPTAAGLTAVEIAQAIYDNQPRTPAAFYHEAPRESGYSYRTFHLRNTRLDPAAEADPQAPEFELCASSRAEADAWEQLDRYSHAPAAQLLAFAETNALYEYERSVPQAADQREVLRLFKCAFVDRSEVNLRAPTAYAGRLNRQPITAEDVRFLAEYLWTFSFYNNVGSAVLESRSVAGTASLAHEVIQAELQLGFGSGSCDRLTVFAARHTAATDSGELGYAEETAWSADVRLNDGRAELCSH